MYIIGIAAIVAGNMLTAWHLGEYFTEIRRPIFNFKPFNCRPCFTFWAAFITGWPVYNLLTTWWASALCAVVIAFISFYIIKSKFKVYE